MRPGYYYFSPKGTPHYPGLHNLGSRDWTRGERNPFFDMPLGEYSGPTEWKNGEPPAHLPLPVLVGSPECIQSGERPGLPIITSACSDCARVLPDPCYLPLILQDKTNVFDCVFGWQCARIVNTAYTDLATAADLVADLLGEEAVISAFPVTDTVLPAGVIAVLGDTAFVWLTGTSNFQQLAIQGLLFGEGPNNQGLYGASDLYEAAALAVGARITDAGGGTCKRVVLCGHSYGGAAAYVLAAKMRVNDFTRAIELLTFGMPKPGDQRLHDIVNPLRQRHYVNQDDPIPYAPPRPLGFADLLAMMALGLPLQWSQFARPGHVTVITHDGELQQSDTDLIPDGLLQALLIAQINIAEPPAFGDHFAASYLLALGDACPCVPSDVPTRFRFSLTATYTDLDANVQTFDYVEEVLQTSIGEWSWEAQGPGFVLSVADEVFPPRRPNSAVMQILAHNVAPFPFGDFLFALPLYWYHGGAVAVTPAGNVSSFPDFAITALLIEPL